jgi:hypothetical protein
MIPRSALRLNEGPQFRNQIIDLSGIETRPRRVERLTCGSVVRRSIQLSYGRIPLLICSALRTKGSSEGVLLYAVISSCQ